MLSPLRRLYENAQGRFIFPTHAPQKLRIPVNAAQQLNKARPLKSSAVQNTPAQLSVFNQLIK